jgi:alanine racemase
MRKVMDTWIEIKKSALINNYQVFSNILGKENFMPVIKANAYGHGFSQVYFCLKNLAPEFLGVNSLSEAVLLRQLGYQKRILICGPVDKNDLTAAADAGAEIIISDFSLLEFWKNLSKPPFVHIKVDTGLSRQGFCLKDLELVAESLIDNRHMCFGLMTHFASVEDVTEQEYAYFQIRNFQDSIDIMKKAGFNKLLLHCASSAAALLIPDSRFDISRVGISIYGFWPSAITKTSFFAQHGKLLDLQPVLAWKSRLALIRNISSGTYISYGCSYRAGMDMRVALIPIGYFEGYPRNTKGAYVLCHGQRCAVLGRVCMNMMVVDVTTVKGAKIGDEVVMIGTQSDETIKAEKLATWADTIQYEIVARLNADIRRIIVE